MAQPEYQLVEATARRLAEAGKPFKVIIIAVARRLLVAINAMIFGLMALSIPSNEAQAWVAGERRPRLGIGVLPVELPAFLRREAGTTGLVIAGVETGGAADRAGLAPILGVDLAVGLVDAFVAPVLLARLWRTPPQ